MTYQNLKKSLFAFTLILFSQLILAQAPVINSFSPTSANSNSVVHISGAYFTGATAVSFGGVPATYFSVESSSRIDAFPGNGVSGDIKVTTAQGVGSLAGFTFLPAPVITSFSPGTGIYGTVVTIKGTHLSGTSSVYFGGLPALNFTALNDTTVTATVGNGSTGSIFLQTADGYASKAGFVYGGPVIYAFNPRAGGAGTNVNITGVHFTGATSVKFGDAEAASFTVTSDTTLTATTAGLNAGDISISTPNGTATAGRFNLPVVYYRTPYNGSYGTVVTFNGYNFTGTTAVSFGGYNANSFTVLSDSLLTAVASYGRTGEIKISTALGSVSANSFYFNYYVRPTITSFSPTSGSEGSVITIKGTAFNSVESVFIGPNAASSFTILSDSVIEAVASQTSSGNITVYSIGDFPNSNGASAPGFTFTGPVLTSVHPMTATSGTTIFFRGSNLSGTTAVSFGGVPAASFTVVSDTLVTAIIGTGKTGEIKLTTGNGIVKVYSLIMIPVLQSFSPESGPVGTTVTISGLNFDNPLFQTDIAVRFGATKAQILSATATQLVVKVPPGASNENISVSNNYVTGYTAKPFKVTFGSLSNLITTNAFSTKIPVTINNRPKESVINDFDGDGKPDLLIKELGNGYGFIVYRNVSTDSLVKFEVGFEVPPNILLFGVDVKDFDGDGLADIAFSDGVTPYAYLTVYLNISTPGNISFANPNYFPINSSISSRNPGTVVSGDLDGDGKADLVVSKGYQSDGFSVYQNKSAAHQVSFATQMDYLDGTLENLMLADMDADGKPEIMAAQMNSIYDLVIYKNTSSTGFISFAPVNRQLFSGQYSSIAADMDGDGKTDIVGRNTTAVFSIMRNTSSPGNISLAPPATFFNGIQAFGPFTVADMNGDGKPDVITTLSSANLIAVYMNTSTPGNLSFAPKTEFTNGGYESTFYISTGDVNGDGQTDMLASCNYSPNLATVLVNTIGKPVAVELCPPTASTSLLSNTSGSSYQWQVNTGSNFTSIANNANYTGTNTNTLGLVNIPSTYTGYQYRCLTDGATGDVYALKFINRWAGGTNTTWENAANWSCGTVPDTNTDVVVSSGTVIVNSNISVRSLTIYPGVIFTVAPGFTVTITH